MSGHYCFDVLIVGGQAGRRAAEGARLDSSEATTAIIGEETHIPYYRSPLFEGGVCRCLANRD
jgi:NADPH-dependent 2,4-dienoyl-CoA reductase/sulfur reductase-like enzyme